MSAFNMKEKVYGKYRERVFSGRHPAGLDIIVVPKEGYAEKYAVFSTRYGSVDNRFRAGEETEFSDVPDGIAHYLEHKLFESETGNAFDDYAKTGASANAFTSFDQTSYLFSCTDNFEESLKILLEFVQHPYFTAESVQKEQGIIGQEIRMYDDDPSWKVFFNLLAAVYSRHPVRIDIAGTVESIAKIDADLLYRCYNAFYNLSNMVLVVAGDVRPEDIWSVCDKYLKPNVPIDIERDYGEEPEGVVTGRVEQRMSVMVPLFAIGVKDTRTPMRGEQYLRKNAVVSTVLEILAGESSPFYRDMYERGLINSSFSVAYECSESFSVSVLSGESKEPDRVYEAFLGEVERVRREGVPEDMFARARGVVYGRLVAGLNSVRRIGDGSAASHFIGATLLDSMEAFSQISRADVEDCIKSCFTKDKTALSVVSPVQ